MILAPSILSADLACLGEELARVEKGGAGVIHVDVMDGHFVPNLTLGPIVVKAVGRCTSLPLDVHLMIENADRSIDAYIDAGAAWLSVHVEAVPHLQRTITYIKNKGVRAGVALNPATSLTTLEEILPELDHVLIMSVNPGFGGQKFILSCLGKIRRLSRQIRDRGLSVRIEVDGGVSEGNIRSLVEAGAEILVAGSAVYGQADAGEAVRRLLAAAA